MTLKINFTVISCILQHLLQTTDQEDTALNLLKLIEESDPQAYNQTVLYHLKQTQDPEQKAKLR